MIFLAFLLATDTSSAAYESGRYIGTSLALVMLFAGICKCVSIMRRPHTSKLCVLPLAMLLAVFMGGYVWSFVIESGWVPATLSWAILLVNVPMLFTSLFLAIVGLALYDRQRFNQGRKQAVWALVLTLIAMAGIAAIHLAEPLEQLAKKVAEQANAKTAGGPSIKEEWNFSLTPPDKSWRPQAPSSYSPLACTAFHKPADQVYAMVIAEHSAALLDNGLDAMLHSVKTSIASKSKVRQQQEKRVKLAGLDFINLSTVAWTEGVKKEIAYEHWIATHQGFAWQIMVWGDSDKRTTVADSARALVEGFRVLDMTRQAPGLDAKLDVNRPVHGYKTAISRMGWQSWPTEKGSDPLPDLADFGAQTLSSVVLVMPYHHQMEEAPVPAAEALARACLGEYDFTYRRDNSDFTTRTIEKPFSGLEITTERESDDGNRYLYLFRIHQSGKHAWMLAGWTRKTPGITLATVRTAMEGIELFEPTTPPTVSLNSETRTENLSKFVNQIGLWYNDREEWPAAISYFREASSINPDDRTYFENITHVLESQNKFEDALTVMDAASERSFASDHGHQMRHAWLLLKAGKIQEGTAKLQTLIKEGYQQHEAVLSFINELLKGDHHDEARTVADAYAKAYPEARPRLWQAQVADQAGDSKRAAELLEALVKTEPDYVEAFYALGEYANRQGNHDRALEIADLLEQKKQETARLDLLRGWAHMGRKWYRDAKSSFEKAASKAPNDEDVKSALKDAAAYLGQGSNTEIKTPIEAVPLPKSVAANLDKLRALPPTFGEGHNAAMLLWARSIHYTKDKPMRSTTRRVIRILNEEGADAFSSMEYTYDPLMERLHVNKAEVLDAEGKVIARAGIDDSYVLDSDDRSMATTERTVHIQVPGMKAGLTLDCEVTVERLSLAENFPLTRHLFAASIPTYSELISVTGDTDSLSEDLLMKDRITVTREPGSVIYAVANAPLSSASESYQQPIETWAPVIVLSGKKETWAEVGQQYLKNIEDRLKPDPAIEKEAKELTAGLVSTKEKARALASFVQKSVRYKAIEFGVRGQTPNAPGLTLQQRYGDCKDQALLLHHMLRACGITSHLALINTQWELELNQPTLDAFNHVIVHVPALKDTQFMDTTASYLSVADHSPYGLWGFPAFVLDPEGPVIKKVPGPLKSSGDVSSRRKLTLLPPDSIRVEEELTLHGYYASGMRSAFARQEPKARFQHAQDLLDDMGSYRLEDFVFDNLTDLSQPAVLRLTYSLPNAVEKRGDATKLRLPNAWETDYLRVPFIKDRQTPFRWNMPFTFRSTVTWDKSLSVMPDSLAAMKRQNESAFGRWEMKTDSGLQFEFTTNPGNHPASEYAGFQSLWSGAHDIWLKELTLKNP